jgi:hypothetical protein
VPRFRFAIDRADRVYEALVLAGDVARESDLEFDLGPWDDQELRSQGVIEIVGPDEAAEAVTSRWIDADLGFEVAE